MSASTPPSAPPIEGTPGSDSRDRPPPSPSLTPAPPLSAGARHGLRVRAVAVASDSSNGIGTVELTCLPEGLELHFISMMPHAPGYVAAPAGAQSRVLVPYAKVQHLARDGEVLRLEVDPVYTSFNRLALMSLTMDRSAFHTDVVDGRRRVRRLARGLAAVAWIPAVLIVHACVPGACGLALSGIAVATSLFVLALGNLIARRIALSSGVHLDVREVLIAELFVFGVPARLLPMPGVVPASARTAAMVVKYPEVWHDLGSTALGVVTFAAVGLGALALGRALLDESSRSSPAVPTAQAAASEPSSAPLGAPEPASSAALAPPRAAVDAEACGCPRADSVLWERGMPQLSVFTVPHDDVASRHLNRVDVDVVMVNNGAAMMRDVDLSVSLHMKGPKPVETRGLFWAGDLPPGNAGKWHVHERAEEVVPISSFDGTLGERSLGPAPADAFFALLGARTRAVRVHAAMMLAYLRDGRALSAVAKLREQGRDEEGPILEKIARAASPLFACSTRASLADPRTLRVTTCVVNATSQPVSGLTLRATGRDRSGHGPAPSVDATWTLGASVAPNTGAITSHDEPLDGPLDLKGAAFDVEVDDLRRP